MRKLKNSIILSILFFLLLAACTPQPPSPYSAQPPIPDSARLLTATPPPNPAWTPGEVALLRSLWLGSLPPLPPDPTNAVAADPRAAALGHRLFFDARLSANNQIACAVCHRPDRFFTDGLPRSFGTRTTRRHAPTIAGAAYSPWLLWDGHKDSLWAQALEPIEHPDEHGYTRLHAVHLVNRDETYRAAYEAIFGPLPAGLSDFGRFPDAGGPVDFPDYRAAWDAMAPEDRAAAAQIYVNLGKAIAAYERLILPGPAPFDAYVRAILEGDRAADIAAKETTLTPDAEAGLRLFIGRANCIACHSGPLFTDHSFHNTGVPLDASLELSSTGAAPDKGRADGLPRARADEFNCLGPHSDAPETACAAWNSLPANDQALLYAFKTPSLRNVAETAPYLHTGRFATLRQLLGHYNQAPPAPLGQTELTPLNLSDAELNQLEAFLRSLTGPLAAPPELLRPPETEP